MLEFTNIKVYDLKECVIASRNAMRTQMPEYTDEEFEKSLERAKKLVIASAESPNVKCHDNFLTGIRVSFDMKYTQYITKQFQRYHWFDYVSSSSMMHRLVAMPVEPNCAKYVTWYSIRELEHWIDVYTSIVEAPEFMPCIFHTRSGEEIKCNTKQDALYTAYMFCIQNTPMGYELFVRVSTNYKQLQTIYHQREHHKLKEDYQAFKTMVENLPYANELILNKN